MEVLPSPAWEQDGPTGASRDPPPVARPVVEGSPNLASVLLRIPERAGHHAPRGPGEMVMQSSRRQILEDTFIGGSPREVEGWQPPPAAVGRPANPARGGDGSWRAARTFAPLGLGAIGLVLVGGAAGAAAAPAAPLT